MRVIYLVGHCGLRVPDGWDVFVFNGEVFDFNGEVFDLVDNRPRVRPLRVAHPKPGKKRRDGV